MKQSEYKYNVFLSHNSAQKDWTRRLAERLRQEGLSVFFDEDSIKLGEDIHIAIENGLRYSRHTLLVLSPEALNGNWVALEYSASLYKDPSAADRTLIPILRKDCEVPLILARLKYLDARDDDFERQVRHLLNGLDRVSTISNDLSKSKMDYITKMNETKIGLCTYRPIPADSKMVYIERLADIQSRRAIEENDLFVVYGPRKVGKTSLLYRARYYALSISKSVAYIDFQMFGSGKSASQLYYSICSELHSQIEGKKPAIEDFMHSPNSALYCYLKSLRKGAVLIFDELDMLKAIDLLEDFTSTLRAFFSDLDGRYVAMIIASYLPPMYYIENPLVSPFNISSCALLSNFSRRESEILMRLIEPPISVKDGDNLQSLLGGHPFMLQLAIEFLMNGNSIETLIAEATNRWGLFGFCINFISIYLDNDGENRIWKYGLAGLNSKEITKLKWAGFIDDSNSNDLKWTCGLYEKIFGSKVS